MIEFPKAPGTAEPDRKVQREIALRRSDRGERVFDTLIEVLEETPEVLSLEYSADLLCDLVCSRAPDVTTQEVVAALEALGARVMALREAMQERAPART
jgi:hypothetical protein